MFRSISRCVCGPQVAQSLLWAVAIVSTSWVLRGSTEAETVFVILAGLAGGSVVVGASRDGRGRVADAG